MIKLNDTVSQSGTVFFWNDRNFYFGPALTSDVQFAYCVKLYIATHGTFELRSARGKWRTYQAALLPIGTTHEMRGNGAIVASLRWAPHTLTAQRFMSVLVRNEIAKVPAELTERILPRLRSYVDRGCCSDDAVQVLTGVERSVSSIGNFQNFDSRIMRVLEQVRFDPDAVPTAAAAARSVNLSLGRFVHLFQTQTGLTFRRYLLGQRLQRALTMLPSAKSLTEVAHQAGFADASHFSRTTHMILGCAQLRFGRIGGLFRTDNRATEMGISPFSHHSCSLVDFISDWGKVRNMQDTKRTAERDDKNVWKGFVAGLVGGLVASWTMNRFQDVWRQVAKDVEASPGNQFHKVSGEHAAGGDETSGTQPLEFGSKAGVEDDTTVRAASAVSEGVFNHKLTQSEKKIAGTAVHYLLGTSVGGLYGAAAEIAPKVTAAAGLPFGAVFWLVVDEGTVPLLGLSQGPTAYPLSTHAYALSSHFVYGLTAEVVRRGVRAVL